MGLSPPVCVLSAMESALTPGAPLMRVVHTGLSSEPCPLLQTQAHGFFNEIIHLILGPPLSLLPSIFTQHYCLFQRICLLMMCPSTTASILSFFASRKVTCSETLWFMFLVVQGPPRALPQHHISNESIFLSSLLYCLTFTCVHSNWECEGVDDLSLGI